MSDPKLTFNVCCCERNKSMSYFCQTRLIIIVEFDATKLDVEPSQELEVGKVCISLSRELIDGAQFQSEANFRLVGD